jgi:hypothetical protein
MALNETVSIDKIEVLEDGVVQVRQATIIDRDGEFVARSFHRWSLLPEQDISNQPDNVKAICNAAWTDDIINAFKAKQIALNTFPSEAE